MIFYQDITENALISETEMTYAEALLYCRFLDYNGHKDWRMPTNGEYFSTCGEVLGCWYIDRPDALNRSRFVIPTRTVDF